MRTQATRAGGRGRGRGRGQLIVIVVVTLVASVVAMLGPTSPNLAGADTGTPVTAGADSSGNLVVPLLVKGKAQTLTTPQGDAFFSLPAPNSTVPSQFIASILVRGPVTGGVATVTTPTNVLPVTLTTLNGVSQITAPLSAGDVVNGQVPIQVHVELDLASGVGCVAPPSTVAVVQYAAGILTGLVVEPTTPADFWPTTMQAVTIWTPNLSTLSAPDARSASLAEMQVTSIIAQEYGSGTTIDFAIGTPPPHDLAALSRDVAIEVTPTGPSSQVRVVTAGTAPVLVVSGRGAGLTAAAQTMQISHLRLATAPSATNVGSSALGPNPSQVTVTANGVRQITLSQLGTQTSLAGIGSTSITQALTQAEFGVPISQLEVRVAATYTPLPAGSSATFSALVGGFIVASKALGNSGIVNLDATTPISVLNRSQQVEFLLNYSPPGGDCRSGALPIQLTMNPSSGFSAKPGQTLAPGFIRSPQNVASGIDVDLVSVNNATLEDACRILVSLSQILPTAPPLQLITNSQVSSDTKATDLVVGATPAQASALHAPLQLSSFRKLASDNLHIAYSVSQPFAAIEEFSLNHHDVVMSGAYQNQSLSKSLTNAVLNDPNGWYGLGTAQVAVLTSDNVLRIINSQSIAAQELAPNPSGSLGIPEWLIVAIAIVLALIVARFAWLALRMRRLRRRSASVEQSIRLSEQRSDGSDVVVVVVEADE